MILSIVCSLGAFYMLYYVRPSSFIYSVWIFILLISVATWGVAYRFFGKKIALLSAAFVIMFFTMNYLAGFQLINTMLLVSFIIGVGLLL